MDIKYWAHRVMLQEREELERQEQFEADFISIDELEAEEPDDVDDLSDRTTPIDELIKRWP